MRLESVGVRVVFVALVLALLAGIVWFPVYSTGPGGSGMRILSGYIYDANEPLGFVLDRLLPAAGVVGILGAALLETGRGRAAREGGRALNRERIALIVAVAGECAVLGSIVFVVDADVDLPLVWSGIAVVVTVALGLYLFWTAEPRMGPRAKPILLAALGTACLSTALSLLVTTLEFRSPASYELSGLDVTRWLLGELSLALWIVAYAGVLLTKPSSASHVAAVS